MYPEPPRLAIEHEEPRRSDSSCTLCKLSAGVRTVCMKAESSQANPQGGLLLVSDYPGKEEDARGRPMSGISGKMLRYLLRQHWRGPVVIDNALKCKPGERTIRPSHIGACRGYLAQTLREAQPQRVVVLGAQAMQSVLGRTVPPLSVRRGYAWLAGPPTVPVFLLMNPAAASRNHFVRKWFEADFKWALTCDFKPMLEQARETWSGIVNIIQTREDALKALAWARKQSSISYDFETAGKMYERGKETEPRFRALCVSIASAADPDTWLWDERALKHKDTRAVLKQILEDHRIKKDGQNEKFDRHCAGILGIEVRGFDIDVRLVHKLQDAEAKATLEVMQELIGMGGGKEEMDGAIAGIIKRIRQKPIKKNQARGSDEDLAQTFGWKRMDLVRAIRDGVAKPKTYAYGLVKKSILHRYNPIDSRSTAILAELMRERMRAEPEALTQCWDKLVRPLSLAFKKMEEWGIQVDTNAVLRLQTVTMLKEQDAQMRVDRIVASFGIEKFDPNKNADVVNLLFERMRLRPTVFSKKTGVPTVDKNVLKSFGKDHQICTDILEYRQAKKKHTTYADPLAAHIRSDGRVHPSVLIEGARTGRPSCHDPNIFNIPRADTPEGKMARDCYAATEGNELIELDYSQLELREAAIESGDELMREIFWRGEDYHMRTAQLVSKTAWGISPEQVTDAERSIAKTINFGILYGMGVFRLAESIHTSVAQAERVVNAIFGKYKKLKKFCDDAVREAQIHGHIWTRWNGKPFRRRPLWRVADHDTEAASRAKNGAFNTKIQGKASDRCTFSFVEIINWILEEHIQDKVKVVLSVYDSILLDAHPTIIDEVLYTAPKLMLQHESEGVPIVVDAKRGRSWGSMVKAGSFSSKPLRNEDNHGEENKARRRQHA